jgi:hypothetical protein
MLFCLEHGIDDTDGKDAVKARKHRRGTVKVLATFMTLSTSTGRHVSGMTLPGGEATDHSHTGIIVQDIKMATCAPIFVQDSSSLINEWLCLQKKGNQTLHL